MLFDRTRRGVAKSYSSVTVPPLGRRIYRRSNLSLFRVRAGTAMQLVDADALERLIRCRVLLWLLEEI